jgi:hypothetical protein
MKQAIVFSAVGRQGDRFCQYGEDLTVTETSLVALRQLMGIVFVALLIVSAPIHVSAQNRNAGEIRGTVTDSSGAVIPGVQITIQDTLTGVVTNLASDSHGVYDAASLIPDTYSVSFAKQGFKKLVKSNIVLHVEAITVDATLEVGSVSQQVTVTGAVPQVQTETSEQKETITSQTIVELPNIGRGWYDLTGQLPGVSPGGSSGTVSSGTAQDASGQGVGVNGGAGWQENWLVDGGVGTFATSQNPDLLQMPLEAISEIDFSLSNFNAEYGNGDAVFNVITKSGTNRFHGSLFEFVQNDKLEARNFFSPSVPALRWNEYGGTIGGPIRRDKAFFFFSYQRNPTNAPSPSFYTYATAAMREGNFSVDAGLPAVYDPASLVFVNGQATKTPFPKNIMPQSRMDKVAAAIQSYFPLPNIPSAGIYNNYYFNTENPTTTTYYNGKVDYNLSKGNRLTGSVMVVPQDSHSNSPVCPMNCTGDHIQETQGQITDVWTFSPTVINEFRFGLVREAGKWTSGDIGDGYPQKIGLQGAAANAFPNISIDGTVPMSIGSGLFALLGFATFTPSDTVTWVKGKHILKFGGEYNRWQDNQAWANIDAGDYDFSGIFTTDPNPADLNPTGLGYADFLLGLPDSWGVSMSPETGLRAWNAQAFAQDDYKITPHLTLNVGVRYQIQSGWSEVYNRFANFDPNLMNPGTGTLGAICYAGESFGGQKCPTAQEKTVPDLFAPRIGFAWSPKNAWSVRGAYGIFDMMWGANNYTSGWTPGWAIQGNLQTTDQLTPVFQLSQGPPPGSIIYPTAASRTPDLLNGQGVTYIPYHTYVPYMQQWHFDIQHQLRGGIVIDAGYVGTRGIHLLFGRDIDQVPASLLGPGNTQPLRPYPQYYGIGTNLYDGISNYQSFQLSAKRQLSRGLGFIVNYTLAKTLDTTTAPGWCCASDTWQNAYEPRANYGLALMDVPQLLNGSFIYQLPFGSGKTFLNRRGLLNGVIGGWQLSSTYQLHGGLPFTPTMGTANLSSSLAGSWYPNRLSSGVLADPTINLWFDPTAFVQPAPYTFGDSGRDILRGPGFRNMNLALAKDFRIRQLGEGGRLQVRAEAYDVFNHPNFGMPDASINVGGTGVISSAITNRNLQLGAKISF